MTTKRTSSTPAKTAGQAAKKAAKKSPATALRKSPTKAAKSPAKAAGGRSAEQKYTDPALRETIKQQVTAGSQGGKAGQWSARKAQLVAHEYEAQGGDYKGGRDETQKSLKSWGDEHWTTKDGKPASQKDGMHRYLPEKAWDELTEAQKAATDKKKLVGDGEGSQFVPNTTAAKAARKRATHAKP